jgi:hypothetical protein
MKSDPIREAMIEEIAKLCADADGIVAYAPAIVDALGLVTMKKLWILVDECWQFDPGPHGMEWANNTSTKHGGAQHLLGAIAAAWKARGDD